MDLSNQSKSSADYLAANISELARQRGGQANDPLNRGTPPAAQTMTRAVARRLIPACIVTPALLWWALYFGQHHGWYDLQTCFILFVFSVTVVFGLIVCLNMKKLARMDAERARAEEQMK